MQLTSLQKSAIVWLATAAVLAMVLWLLAPVLTPFVVAALLAYALTPVVDRVNAYGEVEPHGCWRYYWLRSCL